MVLDELEVRCYSGYTYAQRPESFTWRGVEYQVEEIERAWQEPAQRCFQVRTQDNKLFKLCYNEVEREWWLTEVGRR